MHVTDITDYLYLLAKEKCHSHSDCSTFRMHIYNILTISIYLSSSLAKSFLVHSNFTQMVPALPVKIRD